MARNYVKLPYPRNLLRALLDISEVFIQFTDDEVRAAGDLSVEDSPLTVREHEIINLRFKEKMSSKEVGAKYGIVPQRVNQIENRALRKLRRYIVRQRKLEPKTKRILINVCGLVNLSEREYQELRALAYDKERSEETGIDAFNKLEGDDWPAWFVDRVLNSLEVGTCSYIPDDLWSEIDAEEADNEGNKEETDREEKTADS